MSAFFHTFLYTPIYNLLILFISLIPWGGMGLAVILVTIVIRLVLMPVSLATARTQRAMQEIQPKLKELKEKYKDDKNLQAKETFALYKEHHINPFAGFAGIFIQLPILIGLYGVFRNKTLSVLNTTALYSFIPAPDSISMTFFGLFSLTTHSIFLALIAGIVQYFQARYTIPSPPPPNTGDKPSMQADFGRAMTMQMRYILPVIITTVAYTSGAIALYFITSGLFGIGESFLRKKKTTPEAELITAGI